MNITNPVPECGIVGLGKLLKCGVKTVGTIATLMGVCFPNYGMILAEYRTDSKHR